MARSEYSAHHPYIGMRNRWAAHKTFHCFMAASENDALSPASHLYARQHMPSSAGQ